MQQRDAVAGGPPCWPSNSPYSHATRLLSMIHELHKAGFQHIRFSSGMSPSGMHWRCSITYRKNMRADGLRCLNALNPDEVAHYSTGAGDHYFDWPDAPHRPPNELAILFVARFPTIAEQGRGRDWAYAGWLTEMLGRAERHEPAGLPVFFADYPLEHDTSDLPPPCATPVTIGRLARWMRSLRGYLGTKTH